MEERAVGQLDRPGPVIPVVIEQADRLAEELAGVGLDDGMDRRPALSPWLVSIVGGNEGEHEGQANQERHQEDEEHQLPGASMPWAPWAAVVDGHGIHE